MRDYTQTRALSWSPKAVAGQFALLASLALAALALVLALPASATAAATFASGSGTESDPYIIQTTAQLESFRDDVNSGNSYAGQYVKLDADLDISGSQWSPIGASTRSGSGLKIGSDPFSGTFDGGGHTISGLTLTDEYGSDEAVGLFGALDGGTLQNLNVSGTVQANGSEVVGMAVGLMVNDSKVSGVKTSGTISGVNAVGGVVGRMTISGTIENCENDATVSVVDGGGGENIGGIVGAAYYTEPGKQMVITGCTNNGTVSGKYATGGIAGLSAAFVSNCTNTASVSGDSDSIGGIVGEQRNYGSVNGCENDGDVTNSSSTGYGTGGIIGWARYNGDTTAYAASAPISVTNNTNKGSIKGGNDAGGIVGTMYSAGKVSGNTNEAPSITSTNFAAGIVGNLQEQDSTLPSSVTEGINVVNNVSTTPDDSITGTYKSTYAYNNSPDVFTVENNSGEWVAESDHAKFATVPYAVQMTGNGETVKLIADATDVDTVSVADGDSTVLDLNGHSLTFAESPAFDVSKGTLTVTGQGMVLTKGDSTSDLVDEIASHAAGSGLVLEGGAYKQDVSAYVANGFEQYTLDEPIDGAKYYVAAEKATPTEPGMNKPSTDETYGGNASDNASANDGATPATPKTGTPLTQAEETQDVGSALTPTGDDAWIPLALLSVSGALALASLLCIGLWKRSR